MVRVNKSPTFAAKMLSVDRGTVSDWLDAYTAREKYEIKSSRHAANTSSPL